MGNIDLNKTAWKILNKGLERADELIKAGCGNEAKAVTDYMADILKDLSYEGPIITATQCRVEDRFHVGDYITTDLNYKTSIGTAVVNTQEHLDKIMNLYKIVYIDLEYVKLVVIKANPIGHTKNVTFTRPVETIYKEARKISVGYPILHDIYPKAGDYITKDANYGFPSIEIAAQFSYIKNLYRVRYISGSMAIADIVKHSEDGDAMFIDLDTVKVVTLSKEVEAIAATTLARRIRLGK